jgi:hypothetical protein
MAPERHVETEQERAVREKLIQDAAEAAEIVDADELERFAAQCREIDGMDYTTMLRLRRFAVAGHPYFVTGSALARRFDARFQKLYDDTPGAERVRISKEVGW